MPQRESATIDVLVVGPIPDFDRASGSLRFYQMLQMLARRYRVMLLDGQMGETRDRRVTSRHLAMPESAYGSCPGQT